MEYPKDFHKYILKRLEDKQINELVTEAIWRKKETGLNELHSGDVKVVIKGDISVWRLEATCFAIKDQ